MTKRQRKITGDKLVEEQTDKREKENRTTDTDQERHVYTQTGEMAGKEWTD